MYKLATLDKILSDVREEVIKENIGERVILVKEISFEEAKEIAEKYIKRR